MSSIKASYTVIPNKSTPKGSLWLSDSDQVVRWSHTLSIYIYKENHNHNAIERMRDSLSKILVHYYPLAGRLRRIQGGRLELDCNAKGVMLFEAESTKTLAEYGDFEPNDTIKKELIPPLDYTQPMDDIPLLLVQLTRFHGGNQGLAIGIAISHVLVDGLAAIGFINSWAKLSRGETLDSIEMFPFLDRTVLNSTHHSLAPRFDHRELKPLPLILGRFDSLEEQTKKKIAALLKLTSDEVEKLKKKANDQSQKEGSRPYSKYEVIAAHIWRCASKARHLNNDQPTVVRIMADIRSRLNPPLPLNYFGNALAGAVTTTCTKGEVISNPLSYVAQKIREAIELLTGEYIRSQFDFIKGQEQLDWLRASFLDQDEQKNARFYGNPNLSIISWMSMPVYEADFGWGKPVHFGPGEVLPDGMVYMIRSPDEDGSVIVSMNLQIAHMQHFKKFLHEDI